MAARPLKYRPGGRVGAPSRSLFMIVIFVAVIVSFIVSARSIIIAVITIIAIISVITIITMSPAKFIKKTFMSSTLF